MTQRIRVLLIIPHLGGGGAEQVTALLARGLSRDKYELHLCLVTQGKLEERCLPEEVQVHALGAKRVRQGALGVLRLVRRVKPRVILSGMAHLNFLVLLLRPLFPHGTQVLVRQNSTVSASLAFGGQPRYTRLLYRLLYRHADRVICQSRAMAEDLANELDMDWEQITVLSNPVDREGVLAAAKTPNSSAEWGDGTGPHLLAVGRLSREKGLDLLLDAMVVVRERFPAADLIVAGAGPEEQALKEQSRRLGLEESVRFVGYVEHPYALFPGATVFVLPSRHEGMSNALLEAFVGGLPIVALPCSGGVEELVRRSQGAWLAEDISAGALVTSLTEALERVLPGARFHRDDPAKASGTGEFEHANAIDSYEHLIDETCAGVEG